MREYHATIRITVTADSEQKARSTIETMIFDFSDVPPDSAEGDIGGDFEILEIEPGQEVDECFIDDRGFVGPTVTEAVDKLLDKAVNG